MIFERPQEYYSGGTKGNLAEMPLLCNTRL